MRIGSLQYQVEKTHFSIFIRTSTVKLTALGGLQIHFALRTCPTVQLPNSLGLTGYCAPRILSELRRS